MAEKTTLIEIRDSISFNDSINKKNINDNINISKRPAGVVDIYEIDKTTGEKKLVHKNNLIVYLGREWIAQKLIGKTNTLLSSPYDPTHDEELRYVGIGDGGVSSNPLIPDSPTNEDNSLFSEVYFNSEGGLGEYCDERGGYFYKKIIDLDNVYFEEDLTNDMRYLVIRTSFSISEGDANGFNLSEAGLFTALSPASEEFHMFARVTFPTLVKTEQRDLLFVWYIYA